IYAAQGRGLNAMTKLLRPDIAHQMKRAICPAIGMAIQTGHTAAGLLRTPVRCLVELLLWKRRQQQAQALNLFGIQNAAEHLIVVGDGHQLPFGDIPQVRPCRQVDRRWKLRQKPLRNIEVQIEPRQVCSPASTAPESQSSERPCRPQDGSRAAEVETPWGKCPFRESAQQSRQQACSRLRLEVTSPLRLPAQVWCGPSPHPSLDGRSGRNAPQAGPFAVS